jgi:hypothetical protein
MFDDFNEYGDWDASGSDLDRWEDEQVFQDQFAESEEDPEDEDEPTIPWDEFEEFDFDEEE